MSKAADRFHAKMRAALEHCECDECEDRRESERKLRAEVDRLRAIERAAREWARWEEEDACAEDPGAEKAARSILKCRGPGKERP